MNNESKSDVLENMASRGTGRQALRVDDVISSTSVNMRRTGAAERVNTGGERVTIGQECITGQCLWIRTDMQ